MMRLATLGLVLTTALIPALSRADLPDVAPTLEQPSWSPAPPSRVWPELTLRLGSAVGDLRQDEPAAVPGASEIRGPDSSRMPAPLQHEEVAALQRLIDDLDLRLRNLDEKASVSHMLGMPLMALFLGPIAGAILAPLLLFLVPGNQIDISGGQAFLDFLVQACVGGAALGEGIAIVGTVPWIVSEYRTIQKERETLLEEREEFQRRLNATLGASSRSSTRVTAVAVRF